MILKLSSSTEFLRKSGHYRIDIRKSGRAAAEFLERHASKEILHWRCSAPLNLIQLPDTDKRSSARSRMTCGRRILTGGGAGIEREFDQNLNH